MGNRLKDLLAQANFALLPLFAQQTRPKSASTQPEQSPTGGAFADLMATWWLWAGIVLLIGLIGLLLYLRNRPQDDD